MANEISLTIGGSLDLVLRQPEPETVAILTVTYEGFTAKAKGDQMYTLPSDHYINVSVAYVDASGNAAVVDGDPVWQSSDTAIITVAVNPTDAFQASVTPVGPAGTAQVHITADADVGQGVQELVTLFDVSVAAGTAVAGTVSVVGDPQPKP
jgi:hypothetical protein